MDATHYTLPMTHHAPSNLLSRLVAGLLGVSVALMICLIVYLFFSFVAWSWVWLLPTPEVWRGLGAFFVMAFFVGFAGDLP